MGSIIANEDQDIQNIEKTRRAMRFRIYKQFTVETIISEGVDIEIKGKLIYFR